MSRVAQREDETAEINTYLATGTDNPTALRQIAAERLAAHRSRRSSLNTPLAAPSGFGETAFADSSRAEAGALAAQTAVRLQVRRDAVREAARLSGGHDKRPAASVREAVAARYQESVSYREFLAAAAQRELEKAQAEAEVASRNAQAVATAQRELLDEIAQWTQPVAAQQEEARGELAHALADIALGARELIAEPPLLAIVETPVPVAKAQNPSAWSSQVAAKADRNSLPPSTATAHLRVQLYADLPPAIPPATHTLTHLGPSLQTSPVELAELDHEIAFRHSPHLPEHEFVPHPFSGQSVDTQPIQANIIEFPRQLIASRKVRPRLAEGPLLEDGTPEPQLRIFEVEPELISVEAASTPTAAPEWQSLLLPAASNDKHCASSVATGAWGEATAPSVPAAKLHAAPMELRLMAAAVDACCLSVSMVGFGTAVSAIAGPTLATLLTLPRPLLGGAAAATMLVFFVLYKLLFFTLNEATPGMRYARLAFCTFQDENPSRSAIRRRLFGTALAVCPAGLGLLWISMDTDRLGWHDRLSRMYPRAY